MGICALVSKALFMLTELRSQCELEDAIYGGATGADGLV